MASRRLLYLHNILNRDQSEILYKYYTVQKASRLPGDFYQLVMSDIIMINLNMSENEIAQLSKYQLKKIVNRKCINSGKNQFETIKFSHTKVKFIQYDTLKLQDYLISPMFNSYQR